MSSKIISRYKIVGDLIFLSGVTGNGEDTETQTRNIFYKIQDILKQQGASLQDIVNATVYLTDINDRPENFNPVWKEMFPDNPPTRTCIEIGLAPPAKIEITVIANKPK
jgi:2-iminobutanoate/2-iminopropanoate deaminase